MRYEIDIKRALKKWYPILENFKVGEESTSKREIMATYAEYHSMYENIGHSTLGGPGMGAIQPSSRYDYQDVFPNCLVLSMKLLSRIDNKHIIVTPSPRCDVRHPITGEISTKQVGDIEISKTYTQSEWEDITLDRDGFEKLGKVLSDELLDYINSLNSNVFLIYLLVQSIHTISQEDGSKTVLIRSRFGDWHDESYSINFYEGVDYEECNYEKWIEE